MQAKDIMTKYVFTVTKDMPIKDLAMFFLKHHISGAPVVDEQGKLLGLITEKELIEQNKKLHIPTVVSIMEAVVYLESPKHLEDELKEISASRVQDLYIRKPVTVQEDTELEEIATLMSEGKAQLLPVMRGEELVGIIGKADVVRAITL
jgi:CBS domain-containing protein